VNEPPVIGGASGVYRRTQSALQMVVSRQKSRQIGANLTVHKTPTLCATLSGKKFFARVKPTILLNESRVKVVL